VLRSVKPVYPEAARQLGTQGTVTLDGVIGTDGSVLSLQSASQSTPVELVAAATEAVRQWRYTPTLLNGVPVEVQLTILVNFRLQ
jgi:protein TonB